MRPACDKGSAGKPTQPRQVALAIVEEAGRWLVNRRLSADALDGLWEFPGGGIHNGESPANAAVRECREEVGLQVEPIGSLATLSHQFADAEVELHPILCQVVAGEAASGDPKIGSVRWVSLAELQSLAMPPANSAIVAELVRRRSGS